jgi:cation transport regulator ChaB
MPYNSIDALPKHVKKYSTKIQSQWRHVFNSVYEKVLKESGSQKQTESRAFKAANSILKKRFEEKNSMSKNEHGDYFSYLLDSYLKN